MGLDLHLRRFDIAPGHVRDEQDLWAKGRRESGVANNFRDPLLVPCDWTWRGACGSGLIMSSFSAARESEPNVTPAVLGAASC